MKQSLKRYFSVVTILSLMLIGSIFTSNVFAQGSGQTGGGTGGISSGNSSSTFNPNNIDGGNPLNIEGFGFDTLPQAVSTIVTVIIFLAAVLAFAFLIFGAFKYITSGDSDAGTKSARTMITNAVVGLILLAIVYVLFRLALQISGLGTDVGIGS